MINETIEKLIEKNKSFMREGDYINDDGIVICGKCGKPRQCRLEFPLRSGNTRLFPIVCGCDKARMEAEEREKKCEEFEHFVKALYRRGLTDRAYLSNTFERDDGRSPKLTELCRRYVSHWEEMKDGSVGILFYGDTGGGKSFYACCIANELLGKGVRVLVTRLSDLVRNRVDDGEETLRLSGFDLVVLDDIGVENSTQTAFNIVDELYRAAVPLIVTTNLTPSQLKSRDNLDRQRIYDRILERCCITQQVAVPVTRLESAKEKRRRALELLAEGDGKKF